MKILLFLQSEIKNGMNELETFKNIPLESSVLQDLMIRLRRLCHSTV